MTAIGGRLPLGHAEIELPTLPYVEAVSYPPGVAPLRGQHRARLAHADRKTWVAKDLHDHPDQFAAECIGWLLGEALGVLQPRAATGLVNRRRVFLSEFQQYGEPWDDGFHPNVVGGGESLGASIALDGVLCDEDRKGENWLVAPLDHPDNLEVWTIDHGEADIGSPRLLSERIDRVPTAATHPRRMPIGSAVVAAHHAAEVMQTISADTREAWIRRGCVGMAPDDRELTAKVLAQRLANAKALVARYVAVLEALS